MAKKRSEEMTPEWKAYWSDPKAPHPDSFTYRKASVTQNRVYAPFSGKEGEFRTTHMDKRESFYCHHYRMPDEHYHKTMEELERCLR